MYGFLVSNKKIDVTGEFANGAMIIAGGYYFFIVP